MDDTKLCKCCNLEKPLNNWPKDRHLLRTICRDCYLKQKRESGKRSRAKNHDKYLEKDRIYREKNRSEIQKRRKEWIKENREHVNAKSRESGKKWRKENLEWARQRKREYEKKNREKIKEYQKRSKQRKREVDPAFFIVERVKKCIRLIMTKGLRKSHTTLFYTKCSSVEDFINKMSAKTDNPDWITDNYDMDHIMQRHWFDDYLIANPDEVELIAQIMSNHTNLRPLERSVNRARSFIDVSFVTQEIYNKFSEFWNEKVISACKAYLDNRHLFSGQMINKMSDEEDLLESLISELT